MQRAWTLLLLLAGLCACSDPYEREIPASSIVAPGQAQRIARELPSPDRETFLRWADRMQGSKRFPGEEVPRTVAIALIYQRRYDQYEQEQRLEATKQAQVALAAQEQAVALERAREEVREQKSAAAQAISQFVKVDIMGFQREPVYGARGIEIGRRWAFSLQVTNLSVKAISGLRGELELTDSFGDNGRYYGGQLNVSVPPQTVVPYIVTILDEEQTPLHQAMRAGGQIRYQWLIHSVAFEDGTTLDYRSAAGASN